MAQPVRPLGIAPSFGFGDRIGLASTGHALAMARGGEGIAPIFAQQSIREMERTARSPQQVMADAAAGVERAGYVGEAGADADHLKTTADIDATAVAGFTFFTIDPSAFVDQQADGYDSARLDAEFGVLHREVGWIDSYVGREVTLGTGAQLHFDQAACRRCAVKYGRALNHTLAMAAHVAAVQGAAGRAFELELSVDETEQATSLVEHFMIADHCRQAGVSLISLAPRFIGEFEKGVDYIGDVADLERSLSDHAAIAAELGPYKLSLHSGSDKLSVYGPLARATAGRFHVKTAGTSYLEALRVLALQDPPLFRDLCGFARAHYEHDRATYHVHATLDNVPDVAAVESNIELLRVYLERWEDVAGEGTAPTRGFVQAGRQILHCTFGSVLGDARFGTALRECLRQHQSSYDAVLMQHFAAHLGALTDAFSTSTVARHAR
jgi:hypothetical protein